MGILSDFFICDEDELTDVCLGSEEPDEKASLRNIDDLMLNELCQVVCPPGEDDSSPPRRVLSHGDANVYRVPDQVVERLADLEPEGVAAVTKGWVDGMRADLEQIENEFTRKHRLQGCTVEMWLPAIQQIARLAGEASEAGIALYVRIAP